MNIVTHLTGILEAMVQSTASPLLSWQYNRPARANVENDYTKTPTAVMFCITDWVTDTDMAREIASVTVGFLQVNPEVDWDGMATDTIIDNMKAVAFDFIARVNSAGVVEITADTVRVRSVFDTDDRNLAGVYLQMDLREVQGECMENYNTDGL